MLFSQYALDSFSINELVDENYSCGDDADMVLCDPQPGAEERCGYNAESGEVGAARRAF